MSLKKRTTIYLEKDLVKKVKYLIADYEKTGVSTMTAAVDWGLRELVKRGKIKKKA